MFGEFTDVRTLALHRIQQVELRYEPARRLPDFDIDEYIASGQFGFVAGGPITLCARYLAVQRGNICSRHRSVVISSCH
jgi:hypothetical protein